MLYLIGFSPLSLSYIYICYFETLIITEASFKSFQNFLENKKSTKHLKSFKHDGKHITVNTIQELHEAEKNLRKI
jgi:hypothetical protein